MKKTTILAAFALALLACTSKEIEPAVPVQTMTLRACVDDATKTVLVDNGDKTYDVNWAAGDVINVNGQASTAISIDGTDARVATFTLPVVESPYVAVYPASVYTSDYTAAVDAETPATMNVTLPAVQNYVAGGFDPAAAVLLGKGDAALTFNHAMAYLKITVTGTTDTDAIKSVRVQANDGTPVSGPFTASFGDTPSLVSGTQTYSTATVDCGSGVAQGTALYIAIPAKTYSHGINLLVLDINNHYMVIRSAASFSAIAGKIYPTSVAFEPQGTYLEAGIYTAADYNSFVTAVNAGDYSAWQDGSGVVNIMANIVFETYPQLITPAFAGTLDGHNFTISGQSQGMPLFAEIASGGVVKNVKRGGKFTSVANQGEAGTAAIAKYNYGLIKNCVNDCTMDELTFTGSCVIAGIAGQNGGTLEDCVNNMNIKYKYNPSGSFKCYGGGMSARANRSTSVGKFIRCINNGDIIVTKTAASAQAYTNLGVGGIVGVVTAGSASDYALFEECVNNGDISVYENRHSSTNYGYCVGGIAGQVETRQSSEIYVISSATGYYAKFLSCSNTGKIDVSSSNGSNIASSGQSGARQIYNGGIAGLVHGTSANYVDIISCTNTGIILGGAANRTSDNSSVGNNFSSGFVGAAGFVNISGGSANNTFKVSENDLATVEKIAVLSGAIGWAFESCTISDFAATMTIDTGTVVPTYIGYIGGIASGKTVTVSGSCSVSGTTNVTSGYYYSAAGTLSGTVTVL